eukprot:6484864-Amphidinium_carterae.3
MDVETDVPNQLHSTGATPHPATLLATGSTDMDTTVPTATVHPTHEATLVATASTQRDAEATSSIVPSPDRALLVRGPSSMAIPEAALLPPEPYYIDIPASSSFHILVTWLSGATAHLICVKENGAFLCLLDQTVEADVEPCQGQPEPTLQRAFNSWLNAHGEMLSAESFTECQLLQSAIPYVYG